MQRVQIEEQIQKTMSLFCKQCHNRRFPKWIKEENQTNWLCGTCGNFVDSEDNFIRDVK
jgi:DNA-directed RNA polymerase subunit RPC12/RpoP